MWIWLVPSLTKSVFPFEVRPQPMRGPTAGKAREAIGFSRADASARHFQHSVVRFWLGESVSFDCLQQH